MSKFGAWEAAFNKNFPQKIASKVSENLNLLGAEYEAVAYLGKQIVNGTNHAVLAEQTILNGKDTKNAVILVFNEKAGVDDVSLVAIRTIAESGGQLGGTEIDVTADIPVGALDATAKALEGFVGADVKPAAYLGKQVVNGVNYEMIAEVTGVYPGAKTRLAIITVNELYKTIKFEDLFDVATEEKSNLAGVTISEGKVQSGPLGYAFTWLKTNNVASPLGEWP